VAEVRVNVKKLVCAPDFCAIFLPMPPLLRIIRDTPSSPEFNMAADRFLLENAAASRDLTLRFYEWSPPAISLGCMQDPARYCDVAALSRDGIGWVKRPTGGRAVLHANDITYAFVFSPRTISLGNTISRCYALLGRCLRSGLERAGIASSAQDSAVEFTATKRDLKLPCFLSPNRDEIMVMGKKFIGSAQKRTEDAVLQHGSLPIDASFRRLPDYLVLDADERERQKRLLREKCTCLNEIRPAVDKKTVVDRLIDGFAEVLAVEAAEKPWSDEERAGIERSASPRD
jgi:lipoyl(octanoyl) transferase